MPTLTIDNKTVTVPEGKTILEAAEELGIVIPHFCYHKALGAVGACRMCAVTIHEGSVKGLKMSCLVKVEDGMVVTTSDERSVEFRSRVTEWQMLNHPHDCPVCDEGGECQLQEMTIAGGHGIRRYDGPKRTYTNQDLGPFIAQEMNRCIQCYRCVRTYKDYCGGRDFGVLGSRNRVFFGRFKDGMLESDFSGNIVDTCPTGVFTDRTYRFKSRFWDLQEAPSICTHCSLGCSTIPGGRYRELQRVRSGINEEVNGFFICDRGRFGSSYVNHPQRQRQARSAGETVSVEQALEQLAVEARRLIRSHGSEALLLLGSHRASLETNWLLSQWARELGGRPPVFSAHGGRQATARAVAASKVPLASLEQVRQSDFVLVAGCDPLSEAPMLAVALRQVVRNGGQVFVYDPRAVELPCEFDHQAVTPLELHEFLNDGGADGRHMRELLQQAKSPVLVGGGDLLGAYGMVQLQSLAERLGSAERTCLIYPVLAGPDSYAAGLLADDRGETLLERLESGKVRMLVCVETDPLLESSAPGRIAELLTGLEQLVVLDYLPTAVAKDADLFIPTRTPLECDGSFINNEGRVQAFARVLEPGIPLAQENQGGHPSREFSTTTPGAEPWAAIDALQSLLSQNLSLAELRARIVADVHHLQGLAQLEAGHPGYQLSGGAINASLPDSLPEQPQGSLQLIVSAARYGSDLSSRYSEKLEPRFVGARLQMHPLDMVARQLQEGDEVTLDSDLGSFRLPLISQPDMARGCVVVEHNAAQTSLVPGSGVSYCQVGKEVTRD